MAVNIMGLLPTGKAPEALKAEISEMISANRPAGGYGTTTISSGSVELTESTAAASFEVKGDVTYAAGITWLGGTPPAGFRGVVALSRSTGGSVLGVWGAFSGAASVTPAPVSPAPVNPPSPGTSNPAPVTPVTGEPATWNMAHAHNGWVVNGKTLARYFREPDTDGWVQAWQYPHEQGAWTPVPEGAPTYAEQKPAARALATVARPLGEGDAWVFTTDTPLADKDSVFVANGDYGAKIAVRDSKYAYGNRIPETSVWGEPGREYANGSWDAIAIQPGDKLEIKRSEGYAIASVIRSGGAREKIFSFKFDWRTDTTGGIHGWNFGRAKAEVVRA